MSIHFLLNHKTHFDNKVLKLICDKRNNISQKIKVGSSSNSELDISYGASQVSMLVLMLFKIDICDLFFI